MSHLGMCTPQSLILYSPFSVMASVCLKEKNSFFDGGLRTALTKEAWECLAYIFHKHITLDNICIFPISFIQNIFIKCDYSLLKIYYVPGTYIVNKIANVSLYTFHRWIWESGWLNSMSTTLEKQSTVHEYRYELWLGFCCHCIRWPGAQELTSPHLCFLLYTRDHTIICLD